MTKYIETHIRSKCMDCCDYEITYLHWTIQYINGRYIINENQISFRFSSECNNYNINVENAKDKCIELIKKSNKFARDTEDAYCSTNALNCIVKFYDNNNLVYSHEWHNDSDENLIINNYKLFEFIDNFLKM